MENKLTAEVSISINSNASKVWETLTAPAYMDKGVIKKIEKKKNIASTYWSSMGGKEDKSENYNLVTYKLSNKDGKTVVILTQDNINSENEKIRF